MKTCVFTMNEAQKNAIETNMVALCEAIESDLFLSFMRIRRLLMRNECELISKELANEAKVLKTFDILMSKEGGWEATIQFLDVNGLCPITVGKLKSLGGYPLTHSEANLQAELEQIRLSPESSDWRQFIRDVIDFYLGDYRVVENFDVDSDSDLIESVWVDLQLEGSREPIGHYGEIFAQMRAKNCRLAIVRGQPGSGKTTLVKKIAYDWAKEEKKEIFDLILAIPLRNVQPKSDLLEMAVGFHLGNNSDYEAKRICAELRREKLKILIILDGLDEYQIPSDSPLSSIFGSVVSVDVNITSTTCPIKFYFDLMVTSRPFASQLIHENIAAIKYEIVGFNDGKQVEFVTKRCKKAEGKAKAIKYLNQSDCVKEISQNPFLLTLICFLSDLNQSIPSTLTKLYGTFLHRMLIRAARKNAVGKDFDASNWQQSELVRNLGSLALLGVIKNQFQFNQEEMQMCHVTKEYFHSGLLQYRSDPVGLVLKCDFPHRSIQDFLAAFYAVHYWGDKTLMEATGWPMSIWPTEFANFFPQLKVEMLIAQVIRSDSQFCRFFFGLTSGRNFSDRYRLILAELISQFATVLTSPIRIVFVGYDMADCSNEENFAAGQIANDSADFFADPHYRHPTELEEKKFKFAYGGSRELRKISISSLIDQLTEEFRRGMKFSRVGDWSFSVGSENPQKLKIFYFDVDDLEVLDDIGKLRSFSHIGYAHVYMNSPLHENIVAIRQILTQIRSVDSLSVYEANQPPNVVLTITVAAQQADSPKCFSLKYLCMTVSLEIGRKMLEKFQSGTHFQPEKIKVSAVEKLKFFNRFSVAIVVDNSMSNVDIWNTVRLVD